MKPLHRWRLLHEGRGLLLELSGSISRKGTVRIQDTWKGGLRECQALEGCDETSGLEQGSASGYTLAQSEATLPVYTV